MAYTSYIAVKQVQAEEAARILYPPSHGWFRDVEDFRVFWHSGGSNTKADKLRQAGIAFVVCVFRDDSIYPTDTREIFYNRDGEQTDKAKDSDQQEQVAYYNAIDEGVTGNCRSRIATTLSGLGTWGDVVHNTAMWRLRQTLLN